MPDFEKQKQLRDEFYRFVYALALRDQFAMLPDERADEVLLELFKDSVTLARIRSSIDFAFIRFRFNVAMSKIVVMIGEVFAAFGKLVRRGT